MLFESSEGYNGFGDRLMRKLVLWGHHIDEYREMFNLSSQDFHSRILEYGCGPSAINN